MRNRAGTTRLTLPAEAASVRAARIFVVNALRDHDIDPRRVDDAALLVTELVTNAIIHAKSDVVVDVAVAEGVVHVSVSDSGPGRLTVRTPDRRQPTGRGLFLVDQLASRWNVEYGDGEKTVTFSLSTASVEGAEAGA